MSMMDKALYIIKGMEKVLLKAYHGAADADGIFTIGWGHVITGNEEPPIMKVNEIMRDTVITIDQANTLLEYDVRKAIRGIQSHLKPGVWDSLNDDQQAAIVSFAFNVGAQGKTRGFGISKVKEMLNSDTPNMAAYYFKSFVTSGGQRRGGLMNRRAAEMAMFKSDYKMCQYFVDKHGTATIEKAKQYIGLGVENDTGI